jgi:glycosyltransferase involved in cell wall biosynthesis
MISEVRIPDVSVIIPARNRPALLERALQSVENQIGVELEVIVVDDASEVALEEAVGQCIGRNIRFVRNPRRCNAAYSRNQGVRLARAEFVAFLDSDDMWFSSHLHRALSCLKKEEHNVLYVSRFGGEESISLARPIIYRDAYRFLFERIGDPRSSALVVRKRFFDQIHGFDEHLEKYQDWDFALRSADRGGLLLDDSATVFLDETTEDRMSNRTDLVAARLFLSRHAVRMSETHLVRFFATLLLVSAKRNNAQEHRKVVEFWREYLSLRSFPMRYWALLYCRKAGVLLTKAWLYVHRWRSGAWYRLASSREGGRTG